MEHLANKTDRKPKKTVSKCMGRLLVMLGLAGLTANLGFAQQPPAPCHPNPRAHADMAEVKNRGDIMELPDPLKDRLVQMAGRPHSQLPTQAYAEAHESRHPFAPKPSQLFQYYLLDTTGFEPNPFTSLIPGVNDTAMLTATGPDCGLPTVGAVRVVLEPKPGLPTDPNDIRAFIDIFTDISGLFVINNESGWYEGWMIHDLVVPSVAKPRADGHAQFATITAADAAALAAMGSHHNVPGQIFTTDGNAVRFPNERDRDLFDADVDAQREFRQRFIPSGLANEILLDVYARPVSFEPRTKNLSERLFKAYAAEVARVDQNGDGVISASEGDVDAASDGFPDNTRLFLPATVFNRVAVTREINDGLLAPRFAPSQRGWVLQGSLVPQFPAIPASTGRDADDR